MGWSRSDEEFRADYERDVMEAADMNEPFGRQPLPVTITITGGESVDRYDMFTKLQRTFLNKSGNLDFSITGSQIELRYYPNAVND